MCLQALEHALKNSRKRQQGPCLQKEVATGAMPSEGNGNKGQAFGRKQQQRPCLQKWQQGPHLQKEVATWAMPSEAATEAMPSEGSGNSGIAFRRKLQKGPRLQKDAATWAMPLQGSSNRGHDKPSTINEAEKENRKEDNRSKSTRPYIISLNEKNRGVEKGYQQDKQLEQTHRPIWQLGQCLQKEPATRAMPSEGSSNWGHAFRRKRQLGQCLQKEAATGAMPSEGSGNWGSAFKSK